jgi:hypothetical protein
MQQPQGWGPPPGVQRMSQDDWNRMGQSPEAFDAYYRQAQQGAAQEAYARAPGFWTAELQRLEPIRVEMLRRRGNRAMWTGILILAVILAPVASCGACVCMGAMSGTGAPTRSHR